MTADDAGRFARRLLREMDSLWVFLVHCGVDPTQQPGGAGLALWGPVAEAVPGDGQ